MKRSAQTRLQGTLRSGDPLVDWFFRQCVAILKNTRVKIARKKRLTNPDDPSRRVIRGLMDPDIHPSGRWVQILINPAKNTHKCRDEEVETLIHELAHALMPRSGERAILGIEAILARRFSSAQKRYLKSFIPKHEVKNYPRMIASNRVARVVVV